MTSHYLLFSPPSLFPCCQCYSNIPGPLLPQDVCLCSLSSAWNALPRHPNDILPHFLRVFSKIPVSIRLSLMTRLNLQSSFSLLHCCPLMVGTPYPLLHMKFPHGTSWGIHAMYLYFLCISLHMSVSTMRAWDSGTVRGTEQLSMLLFFFFFYLKIYLN